MTDHKDDVELVRRETWCWKNHPDVSLRCEKCDARAALDRLVSRIEELERELDDCPDHAGLVRNLRAENERLRAALTEVRNERKPQVCQDYELCTHEGCRASYEAFAIADAALNPEEKTAE